MKAKSTIHPMAVPGTDIDGRRSPGAGIQGAAAARCPNSRCPFGVHNPRV